MCEEQDCKFLGPNSPQQMYVWSSMEDTRQGKAMSGVEFLLLWKTPGLKVSEEETVYFMLQPSGHTETEGRNLEAGPDAEAMKEYY